MTNTTDEWLWTDWAGGKSCPVTDGTIFKVKFRSENIAHGDNFRDPCFWSETGGRSDIIAYAVRNPEYVARTETYHTKAAKDILRKQDDEKAAHVAMLEQCRDALKSAKQHWPGHRYGRMVLPSIADTGATISKINTAIEALRKAGVE